MARRLRNPTSGHTILVVDDQEEILVSSRSLLEREGHRVLTARSGREALGMFKENEIHLLFVDYIMPDMNGDELIREIRKFDPYVPIVLQTGYSGERLPRQILHELDIQGYHDKADGPEKLLLWVQVGLRAFRSIEQLRQRERQQGELVANVSHELKNPLNIIGGYAELLRDGGFGALPDRSLAPLRSMAGTTRELNHLVENFLFYAKLEAGAMRIEKQEIQIDELMEEMTQLARFILADKEVMFRVEPEHACTRVTIDAVKVRMILRNLVGNAAKFTARGRITLRAELLRGNVRFAVEDTGPGIASEDLESIFEPFRQLDGSLTRKHGGIGLGLALSRKLAHALDGEVRAESEPGVGSTFSVTIPVAPANEKPQRPCPRPQGSRPTSFLAA